MNLVDQPLTHTLYGEKMALTATYTTISAWQTDAESVIDETLMEAVRQNITALYQWMGGPTYTPSTSHDHDGVNSKAISAIATGIIIPSNIDWPNAVGVTQACFFPNLQSTSTNFSEASSSFGMFSVYAPNNVTQARFYYVYRGEVSSADLDIALSTDNSTTQTWFEYDIGTSLVSTYETFDVSSGINHFYLYIRTNSDIQRVYVPNVIITFDG